jgi:hypothetical protein
MSKPTGNNPIFQPTTIERGSALESASIEPDREMDAAEEEETESVSEPAPKE